MNALATLLGPLVAHGPLLLLGTTIVLAGGCLAIWLHHDPAQRRRLGITTALGCFGYLVLALVPLPRVFGTAPHAEAMPATAIPVTAPPVDPALRAQALRDALDAALGPAEPAVLGPAEPAVFGPTPPAPDAAPTAPRAVTPAPAAEPLPWSSLLAFAWCLGACLVLLRATWGLVSLRALLRKSRRAPGTLLAGAQLPQQVTVRIAPTNVRPFCFGWLRPTVVLGPELLEPARRAQALAVVRHEAAHLRARDPLVQLLLAVLAVPLFCHPLFWWLCRQVRFCSELLADDAAAAASRTAYARELIDLLGRDQPTLAAAGSVAVFHRPSDFYRRIQMLLQREGRLSTSTSRARRVTHALATLSLVAAAAGLFGVQAAAQEPRGRELRKENEALRAELDELRSQIRRLRDELQHAATPPSGALGATGLAPGDAAGLGAPGLAPNGAMGLGGAPTLPPSGQQPALRSHAQVEEELDHSRNRWPRSREYLAGQGLAPAPQSPGAGAPPPDGAPGLGPTGGAGRPGASGYPTGQQPALPTPAELREAYARDTERHAERKRDQDALARSYYAPGTAQSQGAGAPGGGYPAAGAAPAESAPTGAGVPLLAEIPVLDKMFVAGSDGLPHQAVSVVPPERTAPVATTEAIADLASRCLDLQAEIEIAEVSADETKRLAEAGVASTTEARKWSVQLRTLHKKLDLVKRLIAGEIQATASELQWLEQKRKDADATDRMRLDMQVHRARMRLEALDAVK